MQNPRISRAYEAARTAGQTVADAAISSANSGEIPRLATAHNGLARCIDEFVTNASAWPATDRTERGSMADVAAPGETIIVFATTHPQPRCAAALVRICDIAAVRGEALSAAQRTARISGPARYIDHIVLLHQGRPGAPPMIGKHLAHLASVALPQIDRELLEAMTGNVPVVAIIGDLRETDRAADCFHHAVMALPGDYLGTAPVGAVKH